MGSLTSKPKAPEIVPVYVPYAPPVPVPPSSAPGAKESGTGDPATASSEARAGNLLARNRGRLSTIRTSFRGFLGESTTKLRKTLLGE